MNIQEFNQTVNEQGVKINISTKKVGVTMSVYPIHNQTSRRYREDTLQYAHQQIRDVFNAGVSNLKIKEINHPTGSQSCRHGSVVWVTFDLTPFKGTRKSKGNLSTYDF